MKPMLACSKIPNIAELNYPVLASPKLDGIRCLLKDGEVLSRTLKHIPNKFVQEQLLPYSHLQLDGELMVQGDFNSVQSAFMSEQGKPDFIYHVFDCFKTASSPFISRLAEADKIVTELNTPKVVRLPQVLCTCAAELAVLNGGWVAAGYEGAIVRDPNGPYKFGRSTMNQGWMLKLKHFEDDEALVVGFEELMHNEDTSSHRLENQIPGNTLGALLVRWKGKDFKIGTGFNNDQRDHIWRRRDEYRNTLAKFKYQELSRYGIPRFPVFLGFRSEDDV